jgi:hypothetical protein
METLRPIEGVRDVRGIAMSRILSLLVMAVLMLQAAGCRCTPAMKAFDVTVTLDESLRDPRGAMPPVEVNLIGVDAAGRERWMSKRVSEYWRPNDPLRATREKFVMVFAPDEASKTLPAHHRLWETWRSRGAMDLVLIAYVPGMNLTEQADTDPGRITLPLDHCRWKPETREIRIVIDRRGFRSVTPSPFPERW